MSKYAAQAFLFVITLLVFSFFRPQNNPQFVVDIVGVKVTHSTYGNVTVVKVQPVL
jgi:hypothetical protein